MAKRVKAIVKLQIEGGRASPAPPVGPALGQHGVNIMGFVKEYNERTSSQSGDIIPVVLTVYEDRSFTFEMKTPPASSLLRKAAGIEKGSGNSVAEKVAVINAEKVKVTGNKEADKTYFRHSGYPGGITKLNLKKVRQLHPEKIIANAVRGMLPHNRL